MLYFWASNQIHYKVQPIRRSRCRYWHSSQNLATRNNAPFFVEYTNDKVSSFSQSWYQKQPIVADKICSPGMNTALYSISNQIDSRYCAQCSITALSFAFTGFPLSTCLKQAAEVSSNVPCWLKHWSQQRLAATTSCPNTS